jgi:hypothetical protein
MVTRRFHPAAGELTVSAVSSFRPVSIDRLSSTAHAPPLIGPGVASRPAVVAEVIARHPLGPVLLTEYMSPLEKQEQPGA